MSNKKIFLITLILVLAAGSATFFTLRPSPSSSPLENPVTPVDNNPPVVAEPNNEPSIATFNAPVKLKVGDKLTFADGLIVQLKEINDSRCKPGVQCIWAGELQTVLETSGGKMQPAQEIRLGTVNNKNIVANGYNFTLLSASDVSATITVQNS